MKKMKRLRDTGGFTLIEVLVTIIVMSLTVASVASLFLNIHDIQNRSLYNEEATQAAQLEVENLRNDGYVSSVLTPTCNVPATCTPVVPPLDFTSQLPSSLPPGSSGTVMVSSPPATTDLRRVDVTVTYISHGAPQTIVLSSLIGALGATS
jgi:prepilin-type N-terminal cleavage/methylation domain-containing protein